MNESDSGDDDEGRECGFGGSLNCSVCHCLLRSLFSMFIYPPLFFQCLHQHLFLMFTPISFFLMFASVSQKSKFSRQYLVCLSFGTNIRLCHRSALSAQTISQSSLNIVSGEFFFILGGLIK